MLRLSLMLLVLAGCSTKSARPQPVLAAPRADLKAPGEAKPGDRTLCMVSNEEFVVTESSPRVEYAGKTYYFCCKGCDSDFTKDPEKYLRKKP